MITDMSIAVCISYITHNITGGVNSFVECSDTTRSTFKIPRLFFIVKVKIIICADEICHLWKNNICENICLCMVIA